ncbi:MAG: glycosyltransferase family 39 protein [Patescibacteria group bacterium]
MFGNYAVNDDWLFVRQVEAFNKGLWSINAQIDPSFIAQGFIGLIWSKLFGTSFISLQVLTLLVTLVGIYGVFLILKHLKVPSKITYFSCFLLFFNPLIFSAAFSFMTDNYFLTSTIFSIYFFLKFLDSNNERDLILGSMFILLSILVRQIGIFTGVVYVIVLILKRKSALIPLLFTFAGTLIVFLYPRYGTSSPFLAFDAPIVLKRIKLLMLSPLYFVIFMMPLFLALPKPKNTLFFFSLLMLAAVIFYKFDFFPVGNVLYLENLHVKSNFRTNLSLFDNAFFKLVFAGLLGISTSYYFSRNKVLAKTNVQTIFLFLLGLFNFLILFVSSDLYDRYLIPSFITFFILFIHFYKDSIKLRKLSYIGMAMLFIISIFLQWEFSQRTKLEWKQAAEIGERFNIYSEISLNGTYTHHILAEKKEDYTGLQELRSYNKSCYVQSYTEDSKFSDYIENLQDALGLSNPKPFSYNKKELPRAKKNKDRFLNNESYLSFIYYPLGKKAYVASWCDF